MQLTFFQLLLTEVTLIFLMKLFVILFACRLLVMVFIAQVSTSEEAINRYMAACLFGLTKFQTDSLTNISTQ